MEAAAAEFGVRADQLDAADPIGWCRNEFLAPDERHGAVTAYLDGNSLGRPLKSTATRVDELIRVGWGTRLIRSWDESWMQLPESLGDELGRVVLGAAAGQTVVGDSTTVMLYKLLYAAASAARQRDSQRTEIVVDTENFPTDRYVAAGVAEQLGMRLVWLRPDAAAGVTVEQVAAVLGERTAVVLLSHVAYKSAWLADLPAITAAVHRAGALVLWDLCHSAGAVPIDLDANDVDVAVGCSYKFLNGGPGAPAFGYVARRHQDTFRQPIHGWMGNADPFVMGPEYRAAPGIRGFISGTPPILGMAGIGDTVALIERAGLAQIRAKSLRLTQFVLDWAGALLEPLGVRVLSPTDDERRGSHVTFGHPGFRELIGRLWADGVIPDFREPDGIRIGLAPLSTSFREVATALRRLTLELTALDSAGTGHPWRGASAADGGQTPTPTP
ncbi:kynureninase [Nakamurella aerolata]|uniref:Kynureninase n=1 Tax=Nakamurella aerolata TaxID=1656892 RepID=A0A849A513_9ACTN|nr:aminotransferase class V-fold PLP-dependent enzyme [Nakamurella aerolata]NNG34453.1 aminotransferase class V-fold PLP-dependent enzyme [Nakamurella aerolata]